MILACRTISKGEAAVASIFASLPEHKTIIEVWQVDLTSYASVREFCVKVDQLDRLDVMLENAGLAVPKYEEFEGMESTLTVNVISTFLMALLVLPKLRESAAKFNIVPRLTIVASDAHEQVCFYPSTCCLDSSCLSLARRSRFPNCPFNPNRFKSIQELTQSPFRPFSKNNPPLSFFPPSKIPSFNKTATTFLNSSKSSSFAN